MRYNPEEMIPMPVDFSDGPARIEPGGEWMTNLRRTDTETLRKLREGSVYVLVTGWHQTFGTVPVGNLSHAHALEAGLINSEGKPCDLETLRDASALVVNRRFSSVSL